MVNLVPQVFPDPPSGYLELERVTASKEFVAPEDGYFEFIGLAKSGDGGDTGVKTHGKKCYTGGGSGGSGGVIVSSFALHQGDIVSLTVGGNVSIVRDGQTATATQGGNGTDGNESSHGHYTTGTGGSAGSASGGNVANQPGSKGNSGRYSQGTSYNTAAGASVSNGYGGYYTTSGNGNNGVGTAAYIMVMRGNTNIPVGQANAQNITSVSLEVMRLAQEQTSILMQQN